MEHMKFLSQYLSSPIKFDRPSSRRQQGFTLLELLVVISIIGILIAMASVAFSAAQRRGRDARRTADMRAIQNAQEQRYAAQGSYASIGLSPCAGDLSPYLTSFPLDPRNTSPQQYACQYDSSGGYCAWAFMEGGGGNCGGCSCTGISCNFSSGSTHFCVRNLQ